MGSDERHPSNAFADNVYGLFNAKATLLLLAAAAGSLIDTATPLRWLSHCKFIVDSFANSFKFSRLLSIKLYDICYYLIDIYSVLT